MTRIETENLLKKLGKPGENREQKLKAVKELKIKNIQGYDLAETLHTYRNW